MSVTWAVTHWSTAPSKAELVKVACSEVTPAVSHCETSPLKAVAFSKVLFMLVMSLTSQSDTSPLNWAASWNASSRLCVPLRSSRSPAVAVRFAAPLK